jgi:hypothetical protein
MKAHALMQKVKEDYTEYEKQVTNQQSIGEATTSAATIATIEFLKRAIVEIFTPCVFLQQKVEVIMVTVYKLFIYFLQTH